MRRVRQTKADSSLNTARACLYKVNDMCVILCKTQSSRLHFIKILQGSFQTIPCRYATRKTPSFIERRLSRERKRFLTSRALHAILSSSIPPSHPRRGRLAWLIGRRGRETRRGGDSGPFSDSRSAGETGGKPSTAWTSRVGFIAELSRN